jgi:hypothetical protein
MSNEVISILSSNGEDITIIEVLSALPVQASSNGDDSTVIELLSLLPVKSEASEVDMISSVINHTIHVSELDTFIRSKPHCFMKQSKHNVDRSKRYEYHHCVCGCSYHISFTITFANSMVLVKETCLPPSHVYTDDRVISMHICVTKEVLGYIDLLVEHNLFTPNFAAKKVASAPQDEFNVKETLIPPDTQIVTPLGSIILT